MSVLKYKNSQGNWVAADTLIAGEMKFTSVEPLNKSTGIIGYDLSPWVQPGANFMFLFTTDVNSHASQGDWDIHTIYQFDGEFSGLKCFNKSNVHTNLNMANESTFQLDDTFDIEFNQETGILEIIPDMWNGIEYGDKAYTAILFYCG